MLRHRPSSTLFPYTTLFRSVNNLDIGDAGAHEGVSVTPGNVPSPAGTVKFGTVKGFGSIEATLTALERSEEHTSELQSLRHLVCRLLLEKKKNTNNPSRQRH